MKINFIASKPHVKEVRESPKPATQFIPDWWKEMNPYASQKFDLNPSPNTTAKKCFPLLDGISSGYIVTLWSDILVTQENGKPLVKWNTVEPVLEAWGKNQSSSYEIPDGFSDVVFKYLHGWIIKTPRNYSSYVTHPVGFPNLPFRTLTGIVDTDVLETHFNAPFVIKDGFEGIIEKGTPMFQILPFKRDKWEMEISVQSHENEFYSYERLSTKMISSYGLHMRTKKEYK